MLIINLSPFFLLLSQFSVLGQFCAIMRLRSEKTGKEQVMLSLTIQKYETWEALYSWIVFLKSSKESHVVLHKSLCQHKAGFHIVTVKIQISVCFAAFESRPCRTLFQLFDRFHSFVDCSQISVNKVKHHTTENDQRELPKKNDPAI